jgi:hypothetical protein
MFVKGDDNVNFAYIADVIDIGRAANVDHIGLMTPKIRPASRRPCLRRTSGSGHREEYNFSPGAVPPARGQLQEIPGAARGAQA